MGLPRLIQFDLKIEITVVIVKGKCLSLPPIINGTGRICWEIRWSYTQDSVDLTDIFSITLESLPYPAAIYLEFRKYIIESLRILKML